MLISLNELKKLVDIKISDDELVRLIGSRLVEVEGVSDWSKKYKNIFIVKVLSADLIEGTHLHLCKIDAGKTLNASIDPDHDGFIQVVCGAPNVRKDMFAIWIAPGAIVPETYATPEPFEISARKLRGFMSFGMLAAADELALGSDHNGILELNPNDPKIAPGASFAEVFELNDKILEIENKSLTHRPDCFGLIGFAREVAGILGQPFVMPSGKDLIHHLNIQEPKLSIKISDYSLCPHYEALLFDLSSLPQKSPYLTSSDLFLIKSGMRPVSPIVDATNLIMLKTGQPLHAFDYDKFLSVGGTNEANISVRLARNEEKLTLLDGKTISLNETDIVICSNDTPVALAGARGGQSTELDASTKTVLVEIASFSLYNLRKTQMSHGLFSEAITRFTKGRPATDLLSATADTIQFFTKNFGAKFLGLKTVSDPSLKNDRDKFILPTITISAQEINSLLGSNYSPELIKSTLENVGFSVILSADETSETFTVTAPVWRADIHIKEDLIEEVGRLLGYDNLPLSYPLRPFVCASVEPLFTLKSKIRNLLSDRLGLNEVLTYSFVSKRLQSSALEDVADSYKIINSLSPELECFRQTIVPSLLDKIRENEKAGHKDFTLYELNQVTKKSLGLTDEHVPVMETHLGLAGQGSFYDVKATVTELLSRLGYAFSFTPLETSTFLEPSRSLTILGENGVVLGSFGEIKLSVLKSFKLSAPVFALELNLSALVALPASIKKGIKLPKFPFVSRDLTVRVPVSLAFADVENILKTSLDSENNLLYRLTPTSIYTKPGLETKNLSFHLSLTNTDKTFTSAEISAIIEKITNNLSALGAEVV